MLTDKLTKLAWWEFSLIEACHAESTERDGLERALLARRMDAAQVHLLALDGALRGLGAPALDYSRCVRHALIRSGPLSRASSQLCAAYEALLARADLDASLRNMLATQLEEHRELAASTMASAA
jgi:hypothetical protein